MLACVCSVPLCVCMHACVCVCQIFIRSVHIGGADDILALHAEGKLVPMLEGIPRKDYAAAPSGAFNIDATGVNERYLAGGIFLIPALAVALGILFGVHNRWYRIIAFPFFAASFVTIGQGATKT